MPQTDPRGSLPRHVVLTGPTASGKTAAALRLAQHYALEIISVDSALVYRGMDIGSAKPSAQELAAVPHHLINIRDPLEPYSAMEFVRDASDLMRAIAARRRLPLLVGGTMLYLKALADGLDNMPSANAVVRAALAQEAQSVGWPAMHAQLALVDPLTAARLAPADSQRIARALEVYRLSGKPMSAFHAEKTQRLSSEPANDTAAHSLLISLEPANRAWLHERIAQRFDAMLQGGFLDEVRSLRARGDLHPELPSMRCVGYRQAWEALDGLWPFEQLRDKGIFATRQLAKRQLTWLRSMPHRQIVEAQQAEAPAMVLQKVSAFLT